MKRIDRTTSPRPERPRARRRFPLLAVAMVAALAGGLALVAVLDKWALSQTPEPSPTDEVLITTRASEVISTTQTTTTTAATTTETAAQAAATTSPTAAASSLYVLPLNNEVSRSYSDAPVWFETMKSYRVHQATDFPGELGEPVAVVTNGTVSAVYEDSFWGGCLELDCGYGITVRYCGIDTNCYVSETVTVGETIGTVADVPCEASDESHLHLELAVNGQPVDALKAIG